MIKTAEQLAYLAETVNGGKDREGEYIRPAEDIGMNRANRRNVNAVEWIVIGRNDAPLRGNFDGAGHVSAEYPSTIQRTVRDFSGITRAS